MDVPTYPEPLFITDAAIKIFPDIDAKRDIIQNAIDLFTHVGLGTPRVAIFPRSKRSRPRSQPPFLP
jgi:phosphate acetyltransferase